MPAGCQQLAASATEEKTRQMEAMCDVTRATAAQEVAADSWNLWESATHPMDSDSRFPFDCNSPAQPAPPALASR